MISRRRGGCARGLAKSRSASRAARWTLSLAFVLVPAGAAGQAPTALGAAEAAAGAGEVERARDLLREWLEGGGSSAAPDQEARARFLRARLARDLDSAEVDYLWVAVQGSGPHAAEARLRLAQLRLARGEHQRAEADLERLRSDFPGSPFVLASWLWTGNSRAEAGDLDGACAAWSRALGEPRLQASAADRELAATALASCTVAGDVAEEPKTFAVQLGAFRSRQAALDLRDRVAARGISVRVVEPAGGRGMFRIRSGHFGTRQDAARHAVRLTGEGFEAIVVPEDS